MAAAIPSSTSDRKKQLPARWHLASGAISGAASVLVLQPLDLIKTRVQQESSRPLSLNAIASTSTLPASADSIASGRSAITSSTGSSTVISSTFKPTKLSTYSRSSRPRAKILTTARSVVAQDGILGLWRGTIPTLYRNVPGVSLYFLTLSRLRNIVGSFAIFRPAGTVSVPTTTSGKLKLTTAGDLIVGSTARTGVGFVLMPATLLKTLSESSLALGPGQTRPSSLKTIQTLYRTGGLNSLWRGAVPTALRDAPGAGLFIVFYERGRRLLGVRAEGAAGGGVAGASASLFSTMLTTPFDLLKTRRQLQPDIYTTLLRSVHVVWKTSGIQGFWQGGGLRVVRKAGSAGIGWAVYEGVVGFGERRSDKSVPSD